MAGALQSEERESEERMFEILLVVWLCKIVGRIARRKGHRAGWFQFLLVASWIVGELSGAFVGIIVDGLLHGSFRPHLSGPVYLAALGGAGMGACVTFMIVFSLSDRTRERRRADATCPACGEELIMTHADCPVCGASLAQARH